MAREQLPPPRRIPTSEARVVVERLDSEGHLDLRSWPRNESITEIYFGDPGSTPGHKPEDDAPWDAVRMLTLAPGMVPVGLRGFRKLEAIRSPDGQPVDLRVVDLRRCTKLRSLPEFTRSLALFDADGSGRLTSLDIPSGENLRSLGLRLFTSLGSNPNEDSVPVCVFCVPCGETCPRFGLAGGASQRSILLDLRGSA